MSEGCVPDAQEHFFRQAARTAAIPLLWLYADHDPYDSATAIRSYRAAFEQTGGQGPLYLFPDIGGNGHHLANKPLFWRPALDTPTCRHWGSSPRHVTRVIKGPKR